MLRLKYYGEKINNYESLLDSLEDTRDLVLDILDYTLDSVEIIPIELKTIFNKVLININTIKENIDDCYFEFNSVYIELMRLIDDVSISNSSHIHSKIAIEMDKLEDMLLHIDINKLDRLLYFNKSKLDNILARALVLQKAN